MNKYNKLSSEQVNVIEEGIAEGITNTAIALKVFGRKSMESSIRRYKKNREELEDEVAIAEDELSPEQLDNLCESPDWDTASLAKRLRNAQRTNNQLRKIQRQSFDNSDDFKSVAEAINNITNTISDKTLFVPNINFNNKDNTKATLEILLSDLQIGKISRHYDTEVAKRGLELYGQGILQEVSKRQDQYCIERVVFALVGDLVEDHLKHGVQSSTACDTGLAEQMHDAIEGIWKHVMLPIASLGVPVDVMCVTGNHGSSQHKGMDSFKAGRFSYDFVIHKTLESFCKLKGLDNITFHIPDGTFGTLAIYGKHAIYEHGYHNPFSEKGMTDQMRKRGAQLHRVGRADVRRPDRARIVDRSAQPARILSAQRFAEQYRDGNPSAARSGIVRRVDRGRVRAHPPIAADLRSPRDSRRDRRGGPWPFESPVLPGAVRSKAGHGPSSRRAVARNPPPIGRFHR